MEQMKEQAEHHPWMNAHKKQWPATPSLLGCHLKQQICSSAPMPISSRRKLETDGREKYGVAVTAVYRHNSGYGEIVVVAVDTAENPYLQELCHKYVPENRLQARDPNSKTEVEKS